MLVPTLLSYKAIIEYTVSYNLANKAGMANKASKADKAGILTGLAKLRKFTKRTMLWNTYQYNQFRNYFNIYESLTTRTTTKSFLWPLLVQSINKKTYGKNEMLKNKADVFFCEFTVRRSRSKRSRAGTFQNLKYLPNCFVAFLGTRALVPNLKMASSN